MSEKVDKPADKKQKTFVTFYSKKNCTGEVLAREVILLPHYNAQTGRITSSKAKELGAKSYAVFVCIAVRDYEAPDE